MISTRALSIVLRNGPEIGAAKGSEEFTVIRDLEVQEFVDDYLGTEASRLLQ
jgi:hypothetical protein